MNPEFPHLEDMPVHRARARTLPATERPVDLHVVRPADQARDAESSAEAVIGMNTESILEL